MVPRGAKIGAAVVIVLAIIVGTSFFVVSETQQVVITQFGRPVGQPITEAGLHFKLPWQTANFFEKRIMKWDGRPDQITTRDKKLHLGGYHGALADKGPAAFPDAGRIDSERTGSP